VFPVRSDIVAFVCDMLASAGNPEAQAAMRDALSSEAAHVDPERFPGLLQRFSFVKEPTVETMAFLDSVMSTSSGWTGLPRRSRLELRQDTFDRRVETPLRDPNLVL